MAIKFCVFSDGRRTLAKLGEKCIGNGIRKIEFIHDAGDDKEGHPQVNLTIDLEDFKYMDPESFYRSVSVMRDLPDMKDPAYQNVLDKILKDDR